MMAPKKKIIAAMTKQVRRILLQEGDAESWLVRVVDEKIKRHS